MNKRDVDIFVELRLSISRALCWEIIPALRQVSLKWEPGAKKAVIIFYHDGLINKAVEEHYSCIHTQVEADFLTDPEIDFQIVRCDYPNVIEHQDHTIFARCEPFVDPK